MLDRLDGMFAFAIWDTQTTRAVRGARPGRREAVLLRGPRGQALLRVRAQGALRCRRSQGLRRGDLARADQLPVGRRGEDRLSRRQDAAARALAARRSQWQSQTDEWWRFPTDGPGTDQGILRRASRELGPPPTDRRRPGGHAALRRARLERRNRAGGRAQQAPDPRVHRALRRPRDGRGRVRLSRREEGRRRAPRGPRAGRRATPSSSPTAPGTSTSRSTFRPRPRSSP